MITDDYTPTAAPVSMKSSRPPADRRTAATANRRRVVHATMLDAITATSHNRTPSIVGKARWGRYQPVPTTQPSVDAWAYLRDALDACAGLGTTVLALHYQPIVDLTHAGIRGYEALLRCTPAGGEAMSTAKLIDAAERSGLILPLGDWVIRTAIADAALFPRDSDGRQPYVSINVSPVQLCKRDLADTIADALEAAHVHPSRVIIELTETQPLCVDRHDAWGVLRQLRELGVHLALDDYGTGNAALGHLRQPVIDIVKLDRSFTRDLTVHRNRAVVCAVARLTQDLGVDLIVEGIEDDTTRNVLINMGCSYGQGYLFGAPMPLSQGIRSDDPQLSMKGCVCVEGLAREWGMIDKHLRDSRA
jgi:EAL domain-containing protein (putative c-di-GMP-specific phosphodiesterase class I)